MSNNILASQQQDAFEAYVQLQAKAAELVRTACGGRNELLSRIEELEAEVQVWKDGYKSANQQAVDLRKSVRDQESHALVALDGDGAIFHRDYISKGREGGRQAALFLSKQISSLADELLGSSLDKIICSVFYNRLGLSRVLENVGVASEAVFAEFVLGFNAAAPLFTMVDVGPSKEAADAKFSELVRLHCKLSSCKLVLAGCGHDGGYAHLLQSLEVQGVADKIRVLMSFDEMAFDIKRLNFKTVAFQGLFEPKKLISYAQHAQHVDSNKTKSQAPPATPKRPKSTGPGPHPHPPGTSRKDDRKENGAPLKPGSRSIDPKKSLSKQTPPPCNAYFLKKSKCSRPSCPYSHEYALSTKQLLILRKDAKRSPCIDALKGHECHDSDCVAGHSCPWGKKCRYGDKCRFSVYGMHPGEGGASGSSSLDSSDDDSADDSDSDDYSD